MTSVCVLVCAVAVLLAWSSEGQMVSETQRLFNMAVSRINHIHLSAQDIFSEFESSLQSEEQRQLNKVFLQDTLCGSDMYLTQIDSKHETQRTSVLKLLSISYRLIESWEFPSRSFPLRNQISGKLTVLKTGIDMLIKANQEAGEVLLDNEALQLAPYGNYYTSLGEESLRRTYQLLGCFKKDMHKVETYLTVAKCRLSPEANCTL